MKVGVVFGAFDLLHAGHIHLLKQCARKCDRLIVGIHVDPSRTNDNKNKPVESLLEREIKVNACRYVDFTFAYEDEVDLRLALQYFKPSVRFLGSDYKDHIKPITDPDTIPIEYIDSLPIHSSDIRRRMK